MPSDYSKKVRLAKLVKQAATSVVQVVQNVTGLPTLDAGIIGGVDTDFYAGVWNPDVAKLNGCQFAFIRAGQGLGIDTQFNNSWTKSKGVLPRGAYWYLTKGMSNDGQARNFSSLFPTGYDGELPLVVDMEEDIWRGKGKDRTHLDMSDCDAFLLALKKYLPSWDGKWILYSGFYWLVDFGGLNPKYHSVPLWYSNPPPYFYADAKFWPKMGKLWEPEFIQTNFNGDGHLYGGTEKALDLDAYVGTSFDAILRRA